MKLITKLILGLGSIFAIILLLSTTLFYTLTEQNTYIREIVVEDHEKVMLAESLKNHTSMIARETRDLLLLEGDEPRVAEKVVSIRETIHDKVILLDTIQQVSAEEESRASLSSVRSLSNAYDDMIETVISLALSNNVEEATNHLLSDNQELRRAMIAEVDVFVELEETKMLSRLAEAEMAYENSVRFLVIFTVISLILMAIITYLIIKNINSSINSVRKVITSVNEHSLEELPRIEIKSKDEVADIAIAYNTMADSLEKISKQEKQFAESLKEENWIKTRFAEITMKFQGIKELNEFGAVFITNVSQFVKATYGVVYIKENGNTLTKIAAYASDDSDVGTKKIHLGQGLVGQCAADNEKMVLDALPEGYVSTRSGLGEGSPTSLILLPIQLEGDVVGVLELAKFEPFTQLEVRILDQLTQSSGSSIERILDHMKIEELLAESQTQSEELQTQSEELQQQQEELRLINEQLHEQFKQSDEKKQELEGIRKDLEEKNRNIKLGSRYKSEFLANMSHELRTPLNSMLILSQLLSENQNGNLTDKQIEHASTIYSSGKDLLELINDILDLSKIESGKVEVYPEEVLISDIKAFVERQFEPISAQKGLDFSIRVEPGTPSIIYTDDQRLKQILKNLLSNAFKFTSEGKVELYLQNGKEAEGIKVAFSVIDTGIGIKKEKQQSIFEAFYQEDGTITRKYGGTGLGLSISRELSELLGGRIEVESIEGEGSIFTLHLPDFDKGSEHVQAVLDEVAVTVEEEEVLREVQMNETAKVSEIERANFNDEDTEKEQLQNKTVLVVDDDMRNVFSLTAALEMQNMNVLFAENGKEALDALQEHSSIDIILMDIMMPEMNGYEAMQAIRENQEWEHLPILALTAKAMKNDREKCIAAGASDYISKPVNMEQLLSLIKVWLHK
ncbi:signal transduction histidine kinase [Halalkalibacter wakoensis JCM 9140]|uniref:Circadian input-output histidine kinase CikA n=1 Tax=Halalkalibacter wakoensis JCM 9140 TaxID=1236970 RepID=W4PY72_9BACI|nr:response regulator [Halalkalibacter wakoensis]GAE24687.1 signal transduction histidine kinase [Halalkalibacter wakoensis JCM 9140]